MPAPSLASLFRVGVGILTSRRDTKTGTLLLNTGDVVREEGESDDVEHWQHVGFISRPSKASPPKDSPQGIVLCRGDRDVCIASKDQRGQKLAEELGFGETCVYGAGASGTGQARALFRSSGAAGLFTRQSNAESGAGVVAQVKADGSIVLANAMGGIEIGLESLKIVFGSCSIVLTSAGIKLNAPLADVATALVKLGVNATKPALWGPTGVAGAASTAVVMAEVPGVASTETKPSNGIPG